MIYLPVVLPPKGVQAGPLGGVPDPDGLVLAVGDDQVLAGVEDHARDVVVMAAAGVDFPGLERMKNFYWTVQSRK